MDQREEGAGGESTWPPYLRAVGPAAALQQLNKAYELGLEALRVCAGEQLSDRTTAKVERAITAMCNAMPVLDLIPADAVSAKALGELQSSYKDFMPDEAEGG